MSSSSSPIRESPVRESSSSSSDREKIGPIVKHWFYEHTIDAKKRWTPFTFTDSQVCRFHIILVMLIAQLTLIGFRRHLKKR